jgi:hypothetical protein
MTRQTTLRFSPEAATALRATSQLAQLEKADAIRAALRLYDDLLDLVQSKFRVVVRDIAGKDRPFSPYEPFDYPASAPTRSSSGVERRSRAADFIVSPAATAEINRIQAKGGLKSRTDAVRAALAVYRDLLVLGACAGAKILVRSPLGNETSIDLNFSIREQVPNFPGAPLRPSPKPANAATGTSASQTPHG